MYVITPKRISSYHIDLYTMKLMFTSAYHDKTIYRNIVMKYCIVFEKAIPLSTIQEAHKMLQALM